MSDWLSAVPTWSLAFGASFALAASAFVRGSLSWDGALAACLVGGTIWMGLGGEGFIVLCAFFFTSTLLGRVGKTRKLRFETHYAKGHRRDAVQVLANGGVAFACASLLWFQDHTASAPSADGWFGRPLAVAALASLASANADTWATELGVLSRSQPWHLLTWRRVAAGTSGAVSTLGCCVALLGAITIAGLAYATGAGLGWGGTIAVSGAGFFGAMLDSMLGALAQRQYVCRSCREQVETPIHCAVRAEPVGRRWAILNNDAVNLAANVAAAGAAWAAMT